MLCRKSALLSLIFLESSYFENTYYKHKILLEDSFQKILTKILLENSYYKILTKIHLEKSYQKNLTRKSTALVASFHQARLRLIFLAFKNILITILFGDDDGGGDGNQNDENALGSAVDLDLDVADGEDDLGYDDEDDDEHDDDDDEDALGCDDVIKGRYGRSEMRLFIRSARTMLILRK